MIAKQKKLIIISAILFAVLLIVYFAVVVPIVNKTEPAETTAPPSTLPGEDVGVGNRVQMFEHVERSNMKSIEVHNSHGTYTFYRNSENNFVIKGYESALYDARLFSSLVTSTGYTLSMVRVVENASADMWKYGLAESDNPAWYKLTTMTGVEHVVYIGNPIPSKVGYYVRYEGRDTVYVLDGSLEATILSPIEAMITPLLTYPTEMTDALNVDNFMILHGEDVFIRTKFIEESKRKDFLSAISQIVEPAVMETSLSYDMVLQSLAGLAGIQTVKLGITEEALEEYGLADPAYTLYYENNVTDKTTNETTKVENMLLFSEKNEDGTYYVASPMFDIIAKIDSVTVDFLEWKMIKWVDPQIFEVNINNVRSIRFQNSQLDIQFMLDGTGQDLVVTEKNYKFQPDVKNFRQLYKVLLSTYIEDYASLNEKQIETLMSDQSNLQLKMTVVLRTGATRVYEFYPYSERRSYCVIDGDGNYYALRTMVNKIISDVNKVMNNEPVDSEDRY